MFVTDDFHTVESWELFRVGMMVWGDPQRQKYLVHKVENYFAWLENPSTTRPKYHIYCCQLTTLLKILWDSSKELQGKGHTVV